MIKDKTQQKVDRGYLAKGEEKRYSGNTFQQSIELLKSQSPVERTAAARQLADSGDRAAVDWLIEALSTEKKLYPKIEICNSLVRFGEDAIHPLICHLGKVGSNQYTTLPEKPFKKKSYPLPRDIVARTLIRFGSTVLPHLLKVLENTDPNVLSEAIDVIGFVCFYEHQKDVFEKLHKLFLQNEDELVRWKIVRALSAFPESEPFLQEIQKQYQSDKLMNEINRSLELLSSKQNT
ncbi:MAG TPA: HEAT repeat domain-containing protein [Bacteroidales bacterium]|nr:HEAT repeat domain-containing protein [Bacteroidales bacterium]